MQNSEISWTDNTFNPWLGCTKVSPACLHCYAETLVATRFRRAEWGPGKPRVRTGESNWKLPLKWNEEAKRLGIRIKVFCASLADVFDTEVEQAWREELWALIRATPWLDWQLLTKRPENIPAMLPADWSNGYPNVWLGTSVENQYYADLRIPLLVAVPAVVHFISIEPLLGPITFKSLDNIEWGIVGGESGHASRVMLESWVLSVRDQLLAHNVAFFFKQWGHFDEQGNSVGKKAAGHLIEGRVQQAFPLVSFS